MSKHYFSSLTTQIGRLSSLDWTKAYPDTKVLVQVFSLGGNPKEYQEGRGETRKHVLTSELQP